MRPHVSALYVARNSIYKQLGLDSWDIDRDARAFAGPGPVIAHPPCGHWGRYAHSCRLPGKDCGPIAMEQVRKYGGVLEHPTSSRLFEYCGTPREPGQYDLYGGMIIRLNQCDWGHEAEKSTCLYVVGLTSPPRLTPCRPSARRRPCERLTSGARSRTPLPFALLLLCLASQVEVPSP